MPTGYTYFIPQEEHLESRVVTRAYLEAKMVVAMSGRSALTHLRPAPHISHRAHPYSGTRMTHLQARHVWRRGRGGMSRLCSWRVMVGSVGEGSPEPPVVTLLRAKCARRS